MCYESGMLLKHYIKALLSEKYYDRGPSTLDSPYRDVSLFIRESKAYRRLKDRGSCGQEVIPNFYGTITKIQPAKLPGLQFFFSRG